jgi:prevent-host-death family protein
VNPSQKGAIAETAIAAAATKLGFAVYLPVADGGRCDLVLGVGSALLRVQCKTAVRRGEVLAVNARTSRRSAHGYVRSAYTAAEVDVVVAYAPELDRCFAVAIGEIGPSGVFYLRTSPPRNGQRAGLHFADDYELGAIAQLEERLHGMQEVAGSSPASSTPSVEAASATVVGAHEFRNRFGWYMERAAAGEDILVTRRGKPHLRLSAAYEQTRLAA